MRSMLGFAFGLGGLGACAFADLDGFAGPAASVGDASVDVAIDVVTEAAAPASDAGSDAGNAYRALVLADRPIAYFPLDEAPGSSFAVEHISGRAGNVEGEIFFGEPAVGGGTGIRATGKGKIDFGDLFDITGATAFTIEAWAKPVVNASEASFYHLLSKREGPTNGIVVYVRAEATNRAQLEQNWVGAGRGTSVGLADLGHFIHIVFTHTPGVGVRGWIDGVSGDLGYDGNGGPVDSTIPLTLAGGFRGVLDEVAVYDYPLTGAQIRAHYEAGKR